MMTFVGEKCLSLVGFSPSPFGNTCEGLSVGRVFSRLNFIPAVQTAFALDRGLSLAVWPESRRGMARPNPRQTISTANSRVV